MITLPISQFQSSTCKLLRAIFSLVCIVQAHSHLLSTLLSPDAARSRTESESTLADDCCHCVVVQASSDHPRWLRCGPHPAGPYFALTLGSGARLWKKSVSQFFCELFQVHYNQKKETEKRKIIFETLKLRLLNLGVKTRGQIFWLSVRTSTKQEVCYFAKKSSCFFSVIYVRARNMQKLQ